MTSWTITVPAQSVWPLNIDPPVYSVHANAIVGGGPISLVRVISVAISGRAIGSHPWRGMSLDKLDGLRWIGPTGPMTLTFGNPALRPLSFLFTVCAAELLGRDGKPWPE